MSLTTASAGAFSGAGGAGAGGMMMAHQANMVAAAAPPPPQATGIPHSGPAPPPSYAALGADLLDRQQSQLSLKIVRNLSALPIVAVDLYGAEPHVAMFPPKQLNPNGESDSPSIVGKMKANVLFKATDASHKTLRKWLTKSKGYTSLAADVLARSDDKSPSVVLERPQQWLGLRRVQDAPEFSREANYVDSASSTKAGSNHAIAEEVVGNNGSVGAAVVNSTLDGADPTGDDYDRVVYRVRLHESKKAVTVLPEEAVQLLLNQAQYHVARKTKAADLSEEHVLEYPCSVAVPAWACHDASIEALFDATNGSGVVFQRSMCALAGALLPGQDGNPNVLLDHLNKVRAAAYKEYQRIQVQNPDATFEEGNILILVGLTVDGVECTAVEISTLQNTNMSCLFGDFKMISNVSYQHADPLSIVEKCIQELEASLSVIAPESSAPAALVTYGSISQQGDVKKQWDNLKSKLSWDDLPLFTTKADCVAMGTAVLGAVSHGRLSVLAEGKNGKLKAQLGIRIQYVSTCAVGIQFNYHGGDPKRWTPVKTIFDFDRRVPAGPYSVELKASECVVHQNAITKLSDEEFLKASKSHEGSKGIPKREEAALNLRVQVVQKWTRDSEWKNVSDAMSPLVESKEEGDTTKKVACESITLDLSLGTTGVITSSMVGERYVCLCSIPF